MSTHKYIDRICCAAVVFSLVVTILFMNAKSFGVTEMSSAKGYEARLFNTETVHTIDIVMDDWDSFIDSCMNEEYALCSVVIDNESYKNVGIRAKGNTSLTQVASYGNDRYSFKIEFDHYDNTKSYYGLDKLCLNNMIQDNTYMKDFLSYQMMRQFDVDTPLCSYANITVNGEKWGLYLAVEGVEEAFLERSYGSGYGELYKPDSMSMGGGRGNGGKFNMDDWNIKFNEETLSTIKNNLNELDDAQLKEILDKLGYSSLDDLIKALEETEDIKDILNDVDIRELFTGEDKNADNPFENGMMPPDLPGNNEFPSSGDNQNGQEPPNFQEGMMPPDLPENNEFPSGGDNQSGQEFPDFQEGMTPPDLPENNEFPDGSDNQNGQESQKDQEGMNQPDDKKPAGGDFKKFKIPGKGGMGSDDTKLIYSDEEYDSYTNIFENAKTDITNADKDRFIETLKQLNNGTNIEKVVNTDEVIRYFVVHNFVCNFDSYTGSMVHNYYLYEDQGQFSMIPWDYNLAFGGFEANADATALVNSPIDSPVSGGTVSSRPMLSWIFSDDAYTKLYHEYFAEFISVCFDSGAFSEMIDSTKEMIAPFIEEDATKFCTYEEFQTGVDTLKKFCLLRAESVKGQLDGTIASTSDGQQDTGSQIDASGIRISDMGTMGMGKR